MDSNKNHNSILKSAMKSVYYSIIIQFFFRLATFGINVFIVRSISNEIIGLVHIRLMLLYTTIVTLSSEPFVRACLSFSKDKNWEHKVNLLWCIIPVSLFWAFFCGCTWFFIFENPDSITRYEYFVSVSIYCVAALIELYAHPFYIISQILLVPEAKACSEGMSLTVQCISTVLLIIYFPNYGIIIFCIAQVLYACTSVFTYIFYLNKYIKKRKFEEEFYFKSMRYFLPSFYSGFIKISKFSLDDILLLTSFIQQVILKQILTEGEKYIMTILNVVSFAEQGIYSILNNLGSLVVRIIFLPMEEGFYLLISQSVIRGKPAYKQEDQKTLFEIGNSLTLVLKMRLLMGLLLTTFGFSSSFLALDWIYGTNLSGGQGPSLLRCICVYLLFVSVNGITEGFQNAVMTSEQVDTYNVIMVFYSGAFLISNLIFTKYLKLSVYGFIFSNCLNMTLRIAYSLYYIRTYFAQTQIWKCTSIIPSLITLFTIAFSFMATALSQNLLVDDTSRFAYSRFFHVFITILSFLLVIFVIWKNELALTKFVKDMVMKKFRKEE